MKKDTYLKGYLQHLTKDLSYEEFKILCLYIAGVIDKQGAEDFTSTRINNF